MKNEKISHYVLLAEILIIVLLHLNKGQVNQTVSPGNQSVKTFSPNNQPTSIFVVSQAPR
jgi:hypothetical protein